MIRHIARIGPAGLRIPLLVLWFPVHMLVYVTHCAMPVRWGGHPNKRRLLCLEFYTGLPLTLFWAVWDGWFVP